MVDNSDTAYWEFVDSKPEAHRGHLVSLVDSISSAFPELERVMAWKIVHFRLGSEYVLGIDVLKAALWIHPFQHSVLPSFATRLASYHVTARSFQLPFDREIDYELVRDIVLACLAELRPRA